MRTVIVDDQAAFSNALRRALMRMEPQWEIDCVTKVDEHTSSDIMAGGYDLVVLDWNLAHPTITGVDICRDLRRRGMLASIVMLTAVEEHEDRLRSAAAGAVDHIVKDLGLREIHARLKLAASREYSAPSSTQFGVLRLDIERQRLFIGDAPVALSQHQWFLLVRLMRSPGEPVTAEELCLFTGIQPDHKYKNLANEIRRLRARLNDAMKGVGGLIVAVRGVGYVMDARDDRDE